MTDADAAVRTTVRSNLVQMLIPVGVLLLGVAAVLVAVQWETHTRITVEPPAGEATRVGFEIVPTVERYPLSNDTRSKNYLLDKDSGRIWVENAGGEWKEVKVEGITPTSSQANFR